MSEQLINDKNQAWEMAIAGDEFRTKAVEARVLQRANIEAYEARSRALSERSDEIDNPTYSIFRIVKRARHFNALDAAVDICRAETDRVRIVNDIANQIFRSQDFLGSVQPVRSEKSYYAHSRAESYDKAASEIEDWAGVLYMHPVSEALAATQPEIEISARGLWQASRDIKAREQWIERHKETVNGGLNDYELSCTVRDYTGTVGHMVNKLGNQELSNNWDALKMRFLGVNTEAREFREALFYETNVTPLVEENKAASAFLEAIRASARLAQQPK